MRTFIDKVTSRKLLLAAAGVLTGLVAFFGLDENVVSQIAGAVVSIASIITYIVTEGKIDAAAVKKNQEGEDEQQS